MNLALHQLRLEWRRERLGLVLYAIVLFCNFAVTLGWIGAPKLEANGYWSQGMLPMIFILAYWVAFAKVVAGPVIADSPARRDRFLKTRPMPRGPLLVGKVLFIILAALLPAVFLEILSLAASGAPAATILGGAVERFALCAVVAAFIAVFAAHWANTASLLLAVAIFFGAGMILTNLFFVTIQSLQWQSFNTRQEPTLLTFLQSLLVVTALLLVTVRMKSKGMQMRWLTPAFTIIILAGGLVAVMSPFRTAPFRGEEQAAFDSLRGEDTIRVLNPLFSSSNPWRKEPTDLSFRCNVHLSAPGLPEDSEIRWRPISEQWNSEAKRLKTASLDRYRLAHQRISRDPIPISPHYAKTVRDHLQTTVIFHAERGNRGSSPSLSVGQLRYDPTDPLVAQPTTLHAEIAADAFRWRIAADLPLHPGAEDGSWTLVDIQTGSGPLHVNYTAKALALRSGRASNRNNDRTWGYAHSYALYLPHQKEIHLGDQQNQRTLPTVSAAKRYFGRIEFDNSVVQRLGREPNLLKHARLLVLRADHLGRVVVDWNSPEVTLHRQPSDPNNSNQPRIDRNISPAHFAAWFRQLEKPDPDSSSAVVATHLDELLSKVERVERTIHSPQDPTVIETARLVPQHFELLAERLRGTQGRRQQFLVAVLTKGAKESQRDEILAALPGNNQLMAVASTRCWLAASPQAALAALQSDGRYRGGALAALLAANDPALDEQVLDLYRSSPSVSTYHNLRQVPRLAAMTDKITRELWQPGRIVLQRNSIDLRLVLALAQGRPEALEELFFIIDALGAEAKSHWNLGRLLFDVIQLPPELRKNEHDLKKIFAWLSDRRAADFTWDPVFRRFVPKASNNTI